MGRFIFFAWSPTRRGAPPVLAVSKLGERTDTQNRTSNMSNIDKVTSEVIHSAQEVSVASQQEGSATGIPQGEAAAPQLALGHTPPFTSKPPSDAVVAIKKKIEMAEIKEAAGETETIFGIKTSEWLSMVSKKKRRGCFHYTFIDPSGCF